MTDQIQSLHSCWCQTTGQPLHFKATERLFYEMAKLDFVSDDLLCVLKFVLSYNKTHQNAQMKVQVHKLCGDLETFASILGEARAKERNKIPKPTPKEIVLEQFRRVTPEAKGNCVPISQVFEAMRKATNV